MNKLAYEMKFLLHSEQSPSSSPQDPGNKASSASKVKMRHFLVLACAAVPYLGM